MRVTVLGSSASYAGPSQACAGYLVESSEAKVLLDCGNGTLSNLGRVIDPLALDAVFITHSHPDHFADIYCLQALLRYAPEGPAPALDLHLPGGLLERIYSVLSERGAAELDQAFHVFEHVEGAPVQVNDLTITPMHVVHTVPSYAFLVEAGGARMVYSGDTSANGALRRLAAGADLLLCEATLPEKYAGAAPHLTARQAAQLAVDAGAGGLVLTHIWPTSDRAEIARLAAEVFGQPVFVASELQSFVVTAGKGRS